MNVHSRLVSADRRGSFQAADERPIGPTDETRVGPRHDDVTVVALRTDWSPVSVAECEVDPSPTSPGLAAKQLRMSAVELDADDLEELDEDVTTEFDRDAIFGPPIGPSGHASKSGPVSKVDGSKVDGSKVDVSKTARAATSGRHAAISNDWRKSLASLPDTAEGSEPVLDVDAFFPNDDWQSTTAGDPPVLLTSVRDDLDWLRTLPVDAQRVLEAALQPATAWPYGPRLAFAVAQPSSPRPVTRQRVVSAATSRMRPLSVDDRA